jgi:hypothetical protein
MLLPRVLGRLVGRQARRSSQEMQTVTYQDMLERAPSTREILRRRGAYPDETFNDYQNFIAQAEVRLPTGVVEHGDVPVVGSIHVSSGRVASREMVDKEFANDKNWKEPTAER